MDMMVVRSMTRHRSVVLGLTLVASFVAALASMILAMLVQKEAKTQLVQPNFVFIYTDDMRKDELKYMPKTSNLIGSQGMTFSNEYVPQAFCCPSRASVLRGQYPHNHQIWFVADGPNGGYQGWKGQDHERDNLATQLQAGGYRTGLFGKYMNNYDETTSKPPGWDDFFGKNAGSGGYYNSTINDNGTPRIYGSAASDYLPDVLRDEANQFVGESVALDRPFFLYYAPKTPHEPAKPAPRHVDAFNGVQPPRYPSYDEADVSDKPAHIQSRPRITASEAAIIRAEHENRVESLQAVDEAVQAIYNKVQSEEQLANTYFFFTSDNGWMHGEHRISSGKLQPYEESSEMPFLVRGPTVLAGTTTDKLASHIDVMPTLLDLGGVPIPDYVDGRSLRPVLDGTASGATWRKAVLLESKREGDPARGYAGVVATGPYKYIEYESGDREFYDLGTDPYELNSNPSAAPAALVERLSRLKNCAADTCRSIENEGGGTPPPPPPDDTTDPQITITTPPQGATYTLGQSVAASYDCTDADSGVASCEGPVTNGANIDTSSTGTKTFTVDATDNVGNTNSVSHTYTVNAQTTSCTKSGTSAAETLSGTSGADVICGLGGNDTIEGRAGDDELRGGGGADKVTGNGGADTLYGENGNDTLNSRDGVSGNDSLDGGAGTDKRTTDPTEKSITGFP
jgi:N-acetylglucosamine-6-sulfatase